MPIQSWGYGPTITPGVIWANMQLGLGSRYWCFSSEAARVVPKTDGTRQVTITNGTLGGWGILDQISGTEVATLPTVTSSTRWFAIFLRRTWQTTNASSIVVVDAGTSPVVPTRNSNIGVIDDQPLALVPLTAGDTVPGTPRDLRWIGTSPGDIVIRDELAMSYGRYIGQRFRMDETEWSVTINAAGQAVVRKDPKQYGRVALAPTGAFGSSGGNGWSTADLGSRVMADGNTVDLVFRIRKLSGDLVIPTSGSVHEKLFTLNTEWRPDAIRQGISCVYVDQSSVNQQGTVTINTDGEIILTSAVAGKNVGDRPAGVWSLALSTQYALAGAS